MIVTQAISKQPFPGGKNVKSAQAWKYPGHNILRKQETIINGRYYTDPKVDGEDDRQGEAPQGDASGTPRRKQESKFMITINTNRSFRGGDLRLQGQAMKATQTAVEGLSENHTLVTLLKFGPVSQHYANDKAVDVIDQVSWDGNVEVGEVFGKVHAHIIVSITHYSQIQFDSKMIQYQFMQLYNAVASNEIALKRLPYTQVKLLPQSNWTDIMYQYIRKGMTAEPT